MIGKPELPHKAGPESGGVPDLDKALEDDIAEQLLSVTGKEIVSEHDLPATLALNSKLYSF